MFTVQYQGDDQTLFTPVTGESFTLSREEMQSLFEMFREMSTINDSTSNEIIELENRISELEAEKDSLQHKIDTHDSSDDLKAEIKEQLLQIVEDL